MAGLTAFTSKGAPQSSPMWRLYLRIAILVLAIIVLGLAAWAISLLDGNGGFEQEDSDSSGGGFGFPLSKRLDLSDVLSGDYTTPPGKEPGGLLVYACVQILIVIGGTLAVEIFAPRMFYRLAVAIGYILTVIIALVGWAYMASSAKTWGDLKELVDEAPSLLGSSGSDVGNPVSKIHSAEAAAAGMGAFMWVLILVEVALFAMACMREPNDQAGDGLPTTQMNVMPGKNESSQYASQPATSPPPHQMPQQGYYPPQQPAPGYTQN
ncbi:hypothetical protein MKZ38_006306 [Zalerion maritima]|uniref:MARVEL domain-containing protein n=1 Tax=Zalerion maritima TaxID=339359 RepID=A0AAD5RJ01_9PEZI|nr:hypothetical protein MKZ38_006306 [Zalerion maritima]